MITGASSGIGRGIAYLFAREGAQVALVARRKERLEQLRDDIEKQGGQAFSYPFDLYRIEAIPELIDEIQAQLGGIDVLVNNAGMGYHGSVVDATTAEYDQIFDLNVKALFVATKSVLPPMIKKRDGVIINIGSISGKMGMSQLSLYCASKFAVTGFTHSLLEEVREHNIKVSLICPGMVNTEFFGNRANHPPGSVENYIQPEDIAEACVLCASASQTATLKEIVVRPRRPVR